MPIPGKPPGLLIQVLPTNGIAVLPAKFMLRQATHPIEASRNCMHAPPAIFESSWVVVSMAPQGSGFDDGGLRWTHFTFNAFNSAPNMATSEAGLSTENGYCFKMSTLESTCLQKLARAHLN